ncbi:MAG TPA: hypothetical protein VFV01_11620 [Spirillospora sp.]|nr:hypothetical protein [Spirillospora sp.]
MEPGCDGGARPGRPEPAAARPSRPSTRKTSMSDVVFVLLTVGVFVLLGALVRGVEKL